MLRENMEILTSSDWHLITLTLQKWWSNSGPHSYNRQVDNVSWTVYVHTIHKHVPATCITFLPSLVPGSSRHSQLVWLTTQGFGRRQLVGVCPYCTRGGGGSPWYNMHSSGLEIMRGAGYSLSFFSFPPSSPSHAGRRRKEGLVPIARACANYPKKTWGAANDCTLFRSPLAPRVRSDTDMTSLRKRRVKKRTVVRGTPG